MPTHHLKIQRQPFADLVSGRKTSEVRNYADREFREGDQVELFLIDETGNPANKSIVRTITHIQRGYGLPDDICVLSYATSTVEDEGRVEAVHQLAADTPHPSWTDVSKESFDEYVSRGGWLTRTLHASQPAQLSLARDERAEFESWVTHEWVAAPTGYSERCSRYIDDSVQRAWVGWQARAALEGNAR